MTELKTLKDIETLDMKERAFANSIRKEAIKHIKALRDKRSKLYTKYPGHALVIDGKIRWIKLFFNLKESDLK